MKFKLSYFTIIVLLLLFSSCQKRVLKNNSSISYGTFFSMCAGYCQVQIVITDQQVAFTKKKNDVNSAAKTCVRTISDDDVLKIKESLSDSKIKNLPETVGCPDCADGGGEWVEIKENGKTKKITFEYNKVPNELKAAVDQLRVVAAGFSGCN